MVTPGALVVEDLQVAYRTARGTVPAVRGVSFTVNAGEFFTLLGASGCGKTTILRSIAGLETPQAGRITIGGQVVYSSGDGIAEPPYRRDIGMVFQVTYCIAVGDHVFQARGEPESVAREGDRVDVQLPSDRCRLVRRE